MRIIVIGATGTIGKAVAASLNRSHEVIRASRSGDVSVDISDVDSINKLYADIVDIDAVVCAAGDARFGPLDALGEGDFRFGLGSKLMGQVNLVRLGRDRLNDNGVFTLTTGVLAHRPDAGTVMLATINRGLEAFVEGAALDMPRHQRLNAVCPPLAKETAIKMGWGTGEMAASEIAAYYVQSVESSLNGRILGPAHD